MQTRPTPTTKRARIPPATRQSRPATGAIGSGKFSGSLLANLHVNRGVERKNKNDLDGALSDYDEAIRINPSSATALSNRGAAYNRKGEYDRAIQDLDQAVKLKPNLSTAFRNRGDAYRGKGDRDRAISDYQKTLSLNPSDNLKKQVQETLEELRSGAESQGGPPPNSAPATIPSARGLNCGQVLLAWWARLVQALPGFGEAPIGPHIERREHDVSRHGSVSGGADDETTAAAIDYMTRQAKAGKPFFARRRPRRGRASRHEPRRERSHGR